MALFATKQDTNINGTNNFNAVYAAVNLGATSPFYTLSSSLLSIPRVYPITFSSNSNAIWAGIPLSSGFPGAGAPGEFIANDRTVWCELQKSRGAVTFDGTADTMTLATHGMANGTMIGFSGGVMPTGLTSNTQYYVVNTATNTVQLSLTSGGSPINFTGNGSGTITLWQSICTKSLASTDINADITTYGENFFAGFVRFTFAEGATAVTTTDTYQIRMVQTGGTVGNWNWQIAGAGNYSAFVVSDAVGTPTSNTDQVILAHRLTMNTSFTFKGGAVSNVIYPALIMMSPNTASTADNATIGVFSENYNSGQPSGAVTMTMDGAIIYGTYYCFAFGSSAYPINNSVKFTLTNTGYTTNSSWLAPVNNIASRGIWQAYGQIPTNPFAILTADDVAGQKVFAVDRDVSAGTNPWQVNDVLKRYKDSSKYYNGIGNPTYSFASSTSTTVTTSANHSAGTALTGGRVYNNSSRYGVYFNCTSGLALYHPIVFTMSGCYINSLGLAVATEIAQSNIYRSSFNTNEKQYLIQDCYCLSTVLTYTITPQSGVLFNRCYGSSALFLGGTATLPGFQTYYSVSAPTYSSGLAQVTNCEIWNASLGTGVTFSNNNRNPIVSNCTFGNIGTNASINPSYIFLQGITPVLQNNTFWGIYGALTTNGAIFLGASVNAISTGNTFNNCGIAFWGGQYQTFNFQSIGDTFGTSTVNTLDFAFYGTGYIDLLFTSPVGSMIIDSTYAPTLISTGSSVRIRNYNTTVGDYRSWWREGKYISSSGKLVAENYLATGTLTNTYNTTSDTVLGADLAIYVTTQIANSAYYAGTNVLPKLTATYDLTSTQVANASANTNAQTLLAEFTPTTSNNPITVALSQKTDATGANADVTWSNLTFVSRPYGYIYTAYTKAITETIKDVLTNFGTPVSNPFITVSNKTTVLAYPEFTIDHTAKTITVTASTTKQRTYDFIQANLNQNKTVAGWYTTTDNQNFVSTYSWILNTGVALTGFSNGSIDVGTGSFTLSGTATFDGQIIDTTTHTKGILELSGLTNATIAIYDNTGAEASYTVLFTGNYQYYPASSATGMWTWVVKKPGYKGATGDWTPTAKTLAPFTPFTPQVLQPDGSPMYTGSSSALASVIYTGTTKADIYIGNGQVSNQLAYDTVETSLITHDGMKWLGGAKSETSIATLVSGNVFFMTSGWRLWGTSVNSTVLAFVYSTDGVVVDPSSPFPVAFLSSASLTPQQVRDSMALALTVGITPTTDSIDDRLLAINDNVEGLL